MCRLMGYVSKEKSHFAEIAGPSFSEFVQLSAIHCDGWGIATVDSGSAVATLDKAAETACTSDQFDTALAASETDGGLLHLRWATQGLPVSENNAHPFTFKDFSFIHNGAIYPADGLDHEIDDKYLHLKKGNTDSESYFYLLLTEIDISGIVQGAKSAISVIKDKTDYSSINAMLMNEDVLLVICEHDPLRKPDFGGADYYTLKYRQTTEGVVIASSGWEQDGWIILPNHHMMVVDRKTFKIEVLTI